MRTYTNVISVRSRLVATRSLDAERVVTGKQVGVWLAFLLTLCAALTYAMDGCSDHTTDTFGVTE